MLKDFKEKFSDVFVKLARPIIFMLMKREIRVEATGIKVTPKRDPFIMISNHFNTWDSFIVMKNINYPIRFVATEIAFLDPAKKFSMGILARAIPKCVGKPDIVATRKIFNYLKKGYAIGLFPEGDNTFYGETLEIFENTGRLLKKANVDIILVKQQGGYLSQPRWADYFSKKGFTKTETTLLLTKEKLQTLTVEQVTEIVKKALYNNDYDFQKQMMIPYKRKSRAEGIERLIYYCNKCGSILTVHGEGDDIVCDNCGTIGHINAYELIENNPFDNLVDYAKFQFQYMNKIVESSFDFDVTFNRVNVKKKKNIKLGKFRLHYKSQTLTLKNNRDTYVFDMKKMTSPVNTMRHSFSFDYEGETYNFTDIRHQFVLFEMLMYLNGNYK